MIRPSRRKGGRGTVVWLLLSLLLVGGGTAVWYLNRTIQQGVDLLLHPPRSLPQQTPAAFGLTAETVQFTAADGVALTAWFVPPTEAVAGATLIYVHGYGANRAALLDQAAALHVAGYGALLLDLRNHGDSAAATTTWGPAEAADVVAAYNYLLTRPEVNPARIGLVGKSMGGAVAVMAAQQLPNLALLVLQSTYVGLEENMVNIVPSIARLPEGLAPFVFRRMDGATVEALTAVRVAEIVAGLAVPLLVLHGDQDKLVPLAQGEAIFAAAAGPKQLHVIPGAGHLDTFTIDPESFTAQLETFLAEQLPPAD
ncbi:MAG: alpha/beta hydrolase [Chloroflexota bacterium]